MDYKKNFDDLIEVLINQDGSDLHLGEGRSPAIRVNGELLSLVTHSAMTSEEIQAILKAILTEKQYVQFTEKKELDFSYQYSPTKRLRGNAFMQQGKSAATFRLIPQVKTLQDLRLPPILADFARRKQGFFLVVGPVGQGKSATMASMVSLINEERTAHILTIEDPIEYVYTPNKAIIDQREVGIDTEDFQYGLKGALRQDVNVILIGEMRNPETIGTAVTAAETGHLVFSTLHTNNAAQTIDRIIDSFEASQQGQVRAQLAGSLLGIFSQRLIPAIAGGRVPAYELLINNNAVANLIRESRSHEIENVIETSVEQGMISMNQSLVELVRTGVISTEHAFAYSLNPKNLERLM